MLGVRTLCQTWSRRGGKEDDPPSAEFSCMCPHYQSAPWVDPKAVDLVPLVPASAWRAYAKHLALCTQTMLGLGYAGAFWDVDALAVTEH